MSAAAFVLWRPEAAPSPSFAEMVPRAIVGYLFGAVADTIRMLRATVWPAPAAWSIRGSWGASRDAQDAIGTAIVGAAGQEEPSSPRGPL